MSVVLSPDSPWKLINYSNFLVRNTTDFDEACPSLTVVSGDYVKLDRPSRLAFRIARIVAPNKIRELETRYLIQVTQPVPKRVVDRVRKAFLASKLPVDRNKQFLRECP